MLLRWGQKSLRHNDRALSATWARSAYPRLQFQRRAFRSEQEERDQQAAYGTDTEDVAQDTVGTSRGYDALREAVSLDQSRDKRLRFVESGPPPQQSTTQGSLGSPLLLTPEQTRTERLRFDPTDLFDDPSDNGQHDQVGPRVSHDDRMGKGDESMSTPIKETQEAHMNRGDTSMEISGFQSKQKSEKGTSDPGLRLPPALDFPSTVFKRGTFRQRPAFYETLQTAKDVEKLQDSSHTLNDYVLNDGERKIFQQGPIVINDFLSRLLNLGVQIPPKYLLARLIVSSRDPEVLMQALKGFDDANAAHEAPTPILYDSLLKILSTIQYAVRDMQQRLSQRAKAQYLYILTGITEIGDEIRIASSTQDQATESLNHPASSSQESDPNILADDANADPSANPSLSIQNLILSLPPSETQPSKLFRLHLFLLGRLTSNPYFLEQAYKSFLSRYHRLSHHQRSSAEKDGDKASALHVWTPKGRDEIANSVARNLARMGHAAKAWDFVYEDFGSRLSAVQRRTWAVLLEHPEGCREFIPAMKKPALHMLWVKIKKLEGELGVKWVGGMMGFHVPIKEPFWVRDDREEEARMGEGELQERGKPELDE